MRAVTDTGPLLHLAEAAALELLRLVGDLHVPPEVMAEMAYHRMNWSLPDWITLDILAPTFAADAEAWQQAGLLDAGEAEAIALARQIDAEWLLTDDTAARLFAQELGIEVHGSLGTEHIDRLQENPRPPDAKRLQGTTDYSLRVGVYRILYDIYNGTYVVTVYRVRHRREAYR